MTLIGKRFEIGSPISFRIYHAIKDYDHIEQHVYSRRTTFTNESSLFIFYFNFDYVDTRLSG